MTDAIEPEPTLESELEQLLAPILELSEAEQSAALAAACGAHPVHAEALRSRHAILHRLGLAAEDVRPSLHGPQQLGDCFGPFRLVRKLGQGGMGIVYLAQDPQLGREVALKLIRPEYLASERARERFRREVGVAARIDHPGLCAVHGAGEIDGQPYLVLQYLRGATLETLLRRARAEGRTAWSDGLPDSDPGTPAGGRVRPVDLRRALELIEQLARAVHCAHEAGLVHRDLKPGNVMVTPEGRPVLMDFGLASDAASSAAGLTATGELVGTPIYMAPEQVTPKGRQVDRRTDVHALGAILYECLTLRPPYTAAGREELYHRILAEEPIELKRLQPAASRDLANVVHRALAKEPARRYPTALALAEDLRRVLAGEPTLARPPGALRRAGLAAKKHRTIAAVGAALLLGLAASLASLWASWRANQRSRALLIAAGAKEVLPESPEVAYAALRAALDLAPEPDVVAALHLVLPELASWSLVRQVDARMESLTLSPSRRFVVVNCSGGAAALHRGDDGAFVADLAVPSPPGERPAPLTPQRPAVAFSPDERAMWAMCAGSGIHRFALESGGKTLVGTPPVSGRAIDAMSLAWSPDGERLLVTQRNLRRGVPRCWASLHDATTGEELAGDLPLGPESWGCGFLADGTLVLPNALWSADGRNKLADLAAGPGAARMVLVAGDRFAVVSTAGVRVFASRGDLVGAKEREGQRGFETLTHAEWSPGHDVLVASFQDGEVWVLDASAAIRHSWNVGSTSHARFLLDGGHILTGDTKGRTIVWTLAGRPRQRLLGHRNNAYAAPVRNGDVLVVSWDGRARLWHLDRSPEGLPLQSGVPRGRTLVVDGLLVVTDAEGRVRSLDAGGTLLETTAVRRGEVFLAPHRDQRTVWLIEDQGIVLWRWDPRTGAREGPFEHDRGSANPPVSIAHLADDRLLLANSYEGFPRLLVPGQRLSSIRAFKASYVAAAGGRTVAVGTDQPDEAVAPAAVKLLLLADDGESVAWSAVDPAGSGRARGSALTLDRAGRRALVGYQNGAVSLWDLDSRTLLAWWRDHADVVNSVALTPDGAHVASCTRQGHLVVRRLEVERPMLTWRSPEERFRTLSFVDDHTLVSTGIDFERLRFWWWEPDRLRAVLARVPLPSLDIEQTRDLARVLGR